MENGDEQVLIAKGHRPDLINSQDFRSPCSISRSRTEWDRWLLMGLIGTAVGVLGFLIHQVIDLLIKLKWNLVENYLQVKNLLHMNILAFTLTILLGVFGGLLGAFFVSLNIKVYRYTGALYGRIMGLILVSVFGVQTNEYGAWIDPGFSTAIAAASSFSGVSRLNISVTVIMVEPGIVLCQGCHGDWRQSPSPEGEHCLLGLTSCKYKPWWIPSGLQSQARTRRDVPGLELCMLLENKHILEGESPSPPLILSPMRRSQTGKLLNPGFQYAAQKEREMSSCLFQITVEKLPNLSCLTMLLNRFTTDPWYQQLFINLEPYINKSSMSVQAHFSLQCSYVIFHTLGLCHLTVDLQNRVVRVITRKDTMSLPLEERLTLQQLPQSPDADELPPESRPCMHS